jgi:hypothetical protein
MHGTSPHHYIDATLLINNVQDIVIIRVEVLDLALRLEKQQQQKL